MEVFVDYFLLLEVHMLASDEAIKASYRRLSAKYHPDNGGDKDKYIVIQEAYNNLIDHKLRDLYINNWKEVCFKRNMKYDTDLDSNIYDNSFNFIREAINEYMFLIMNNEYELAYDCLCIETKDNLFKKEFMLWQRLIGEVHELLEFECIIETFNLPKHFNKFIKSDYKIITFRVKILELNLLLNRVEEDFFSRDMIYEEGSWKVLLPKVDIKNIIKKYKNIIQINKKNKMKYQRRATILNESYLTKKISPEPFMHNLEYEYLRFERYQRVFSIISIEINCELEINIQYGFIEKLIEQNTRKLDSFTSIKECVYMIILPETNQKGASIVVEKLIFAALDLNTKIPIQIKGITINESYKSVKSFVNALVNIE